MSTKITLSSSELTKNIAALRKLLQQSNVQAAYISSFDPYLNEYVPLEDCHRFYLSGFTGSVAEVLVPLNGKVRLYVDGRYHEQADNEVDLKQIEVVKVPSNKGIAQAMFEEIAKLEIKSVGIENARTSLSTLKSLQKLANIVALDEEEIARVIKFSELTNNNPIEHLPRSLRGRDTLEKVTSFIKNDQEAFYITALDSISWLTNCRGYQLKNQSAFKGKALATKEKVYVYLNEDNTTDLSIDGIEWVIMKSPEDLKGHFDQLHNRKHFKKVSFDPAGINCQDFKSLLEVFGPEVIKEVPGGIVWQQSIKEKIELDQFEESFNCSNKAIVNTMKWVRSSLDTNQKISELDIYHQTTQEYEKQGSKEQSFNTISGVGANGSIIHFSKPSAEVQVKPDDIVLLDSGGYFASGFATDTTRTFLASSKVEGSSKAKEIYTLVLKGVIQAESAVFPEGTKGNVIDGFARGAMMKKGYNFAHGTGHGVGVNVHEGGVRISPASDLPMKAGQVVSIEPGIYIAGFGGVRLENIVIVEKHPEFQGYLRFRPITYIGYDPKLIDENLLTFEEKEYLYAYEKECERRGTSLRVIS